METYKFDQVIDIAKHSNCATCETYIYTLPCAIEVDFGDFIQSVGKLVHPLNKIQLLRVKNEYLTIASRLGTRTLEIKFLQSMADIKPLLELGLAGYVSEKQDINIEM